MPAQNWSQGAHDSVIRAATQVLQIARARLHSGDERTAESVDRLAQAIGDRFDDVDTKTPRVANLVREVCHQLHVTGLLTAEESRGLTRGVDGVR
jgi:hypothetical protein